MAEIIRTYTREDGHVINVYASGTEYDTTSGELCRGPEHGKITRENVTEFNRLRKQKAARLLREAIRQTTKDKLKMDTLPGSAQVVAAAGGMIWGDVVLNELAYPRDRLDAWRAIGERAEVLPGPGDKQAEEGAVTAAAFGTAAARAVIALAERLNAYANSNYREHEADTVDAETVTPALPQAGTHEAEAHEDQDDDE